MTKRKIEQVTNPCASCGRQLKGLHDPNTYWDEHEIDGTKLCRRCYNDESVMESLLHKALQQVLPDMKRGEFDLLLTALKRLISLRAHEIAADAAREARRDPYDS